MGILICGMMAVPCWREAHYAPCNHSNPFAWGRLQTAPSAGRWHSGAGEGEPGLDWAPRAPGWVGQGCCLCHSMGRHQAAPAELL